MSQPHDEISAAAQAYDTDENLRADVNGDQLPDLEDLNLDQLPE